MELNGIEFKTIIAEILLKDRLMNIKYIVYYLYITGTYTIFKINSYLSYKTNSLLTIKILIKYRRKPGKRDTSLNGGRLNY